MFIVLIFGLKVLFASSTCFNFRSCCSCNREPSISNDNTASISTSSDESVKTKIKFSRKKLIKYRKSLISESEWDKLEHSKQISLLQRLELHTNPRIAAIEQLDLSATGMVCIISADLSIAFNYLFMLLVSLPPNQISHLPGIVFRMDIFIYKSLFDNELLDTCNDIIFALYYANINQQTDCTKIKDRNVYSRKIIKHIEDGVKEEKVNLFYKSFEFYLEKCDD